MIDLRKAGLLEPLLRLPHSFVMPDALFEDEWLCLSQNDKQILRNLGLDVRTCPVTSSNAPPGISINTRD